LTRYFEVTTGNELMLGNNTALPRSADDFFRLQAVPLSLTQISRLI